VLGGGVVVVVAVVVRVGGGRVRGGTVAAVVVVGDGVIGVAVRGAVAAVGRGVPGARRRRRSWMRRWMIILLVAVGVCSRVRVLLGVPTVLPRNTRTLARISI
jgi:hypothetical protein